MKNTSKLFIVLAALLLSATLMVAQHNHAAATNQPATEGTDNDMMKSCQKHGAESMAALDKLEKTITAGRESNDPAKMKAALDQAQTQLAEAKHHMSMCPMMSGGTMHHGNMDHMQHTHGMCGQQQSAPDTSKTPQ